MSNRAAIIPNAEGGVDVRRSIVSTSKLCLASAFHEAAQTPGFVRFPSEAAVYGTAVHATIEPVLTGERPLSGQEALDLALAKDGILWGDTGLSLTAYDEMVDEIDQACTTWEAMVWPSVQGRHVLHAEDTLRRDLGDGITFLTGAPDFVFAGDDGIPEVWDWKTSGKAWPERRIDKEDQPKAYPWLLGEEFDDESLPFAFVVYSRADMEWTFHEREITPEARQAWRVDALARARSLAYRTEPASYTVIGTEYHPTRNWFCSSKWCGWWNECEAKHIYDNGGVNLAAPIVTTW